MSEFKCNECNKEFSSKEALEMHNNSKHFVKIKKPINKKKLRNWGIFFGIVILLVLGAYGLMLNDAKPGKYDNFAQCLSDKGAKMYGAYWCPHCQDQKQLFGKSFDKVTYIECSLPNQGGQNELCNNQNITSYPTWEFAEGDKQLGALSLETLSSLTNCSINTK